MKAFKEGLEEGNRVAQDRQSAWERQPLAYKLVELALVVAAAVTYLVLFAKG